MSQIASSGTTALVTSVALTTTPLLHASDNLDLSLAGGLRFEDNLVVEPLDVSSPESDFAAVGELDIGYQQDDVWDGSDVRAGYVLEDRRYFEEQDFNLQLHYGFLDLSREFSGVTAGALVDLTHARVGGGSLLNQQQLSGYVSDLVRPGLYLRGSLELERTRYDSDAERNNNGQQVDGSAFYFIDGTTQYLTAKARLSQEQADNSVFDYQAQRISFGYVERLGVPEEWPVRIRADWRYEVRRYDNFDPSLGAKRQDFRNRWRLRLDAPVSESVSLELKMEHRRYNSNSPAMDFNDNRIEFLVDVALL